MTTVSPLTDLHMAPSLLGARVCHHTEQVLVGVLADLREGNTLRATMTLGVATTTNFALTALCVSGLCASASAAGVEAGLALPSIALSALAGFVEAAVRVSAAARQSDAK
jgi:hypothetical protein